VDTLRQTINRYPLTCFVVATYTLSWWSVPFANGAIIPYGPFLAAVLMVFITKGRSGLGEWFRRIVTWQGGWKWLLIAPGLVGLYLALAFAVNLLLGARIAQTSHLDAFGVTLVTLILFGGMWEEPGWTGYALPLLQHRNAGRPYGLLKATLTLGCIRAGWHVPLMLSGAIPWYDVLFLSFAIQFLIAWLHNRTSGGVIPPMLLHLASNVFGGGIMLALFVGADHGRYYVLFIAFAVLLAVILNLPRRWSMGQRGHTNSPEGA